MIELSSRLEELSPAKRELLLRQLKKMRGEVPRPALVPRGGSLGDFPLSYAQQRLWFLDQLEPGNPFYNIPGAVRLAGPLDEGALARALAGVVARHEALRTTFPEVGGNPVQRVGPPAAVPLPLVDLSALPAELRRRAARAHASAVARLPFDLARGPLLRAALLRLGPEERVLAFALHHTVSDGWSMRVLVRELTALYRAEATGEAPGLPPLPVQYADYAVAERRWLDGETLAPQLDYWRRQLADLPAPLELPADRPRPEVQTFRGASLGLALSAGTLAGARALAQAEKATPFMLLLAGFLAVLHRYSGRDDIPVGTPVANRDRVETEGLIGFFVNTLVLRGDLAGDPTFRGLLARVRETTLAAFAHPDLPFERLVEELHPERDLAHTPVFQVLFAFQSMPVEARASSGLSMEALPVEAGKALFDLTLTLEETPARIAGAFEYNTGLFDAARIRRLAGHFEAVLAAAAADPDLPVSALPLFAASERHQLAVEWTDTALAPAGGARVHERFAAQAARTPEAPAVIWGEETVTYAELDARAGRLARALAAAGAGRETRVGVCLPRTPELVAALLAVWKAGAAYVPMDPAYPEERLAYMLEDSGATVLVAGDGLPEGLAGKVATIVRPDDSGDGEPLPVVAGDASDLAYVIYTSGSTGRPKGGAIAHASAGVLLDWAHEVFSPAELAGVLASTSVCFDLSVFELFAPLTRGGAVVLADNALELPRLPAAGRVTLVNTVPSAMGELARSGGLPPSVRTVNLAGEALRRGLVDRVYETATVERVLNLYGPSEDTTYSTFARVPKGSSAPPTVGRPVADTRAWVVDPRGALVPLGVPGEVWLAGAGLARGYLGRPDLTAERFLPDPFAPAGSPGSRLYRTGDLARWSPSGELEFLGRIDHQVKVRGFRIELGEVETALERHPAVERAAVLAAPDGQSLAAWIAGPEAASVSAAELRAFLRASLPEHMVPSLFVPLAALPLTPSGKVDRRALAAAQPRPASAVMTVESVPPRTPEEELLAGIWESVLGREGIGAHDNFFDLGGHSLLATRTVSRIREAFGVELPLRALFEAPTVAGLAAKVEAARRAGGAAVPPIVRVPREGRLPLSFGQQRLWFLDQLEPGSPAYNMPAAVRLAGGLDPAALSAALSEVVRRHEALRTVFRGPEGAADEPAQAVRPAAPAVLPLADLSALPDGARAAEARRLATAEARRPFDLARGPLLRAGLVRLGAREHLLLLTLHHIVSDGWSLGVLLRELTALYGAFSRGLPSPLPELPVQYADYAAWQRGWLKGEVLEAQLAHWRRALAGVPPLLDLPTDRPRPPMQTFRGDRAALPLPAGLAGAVRDLARAAGATPFMVLLAVVQLLLRRLSGQPVVAVGSPIANRGRAETEGLIGFFANTLVLAGAPVDDQGFRALVAQAREAALGAYAHQDLPFEKLVEELAPERNLAHAPLFQVMLSFQAAQAQEPGAGPADSGLAISPIESDVAAAKFDLTFDFEERGRGLAAGLEYNTDLFDAATAGRLLTQLRDLLAAAAADPDAAAGDLPLLAGAQAAQLLVEWNDVPLAADPGLCLHELILERARERPDEPAVIAPEGALTRAELAARSGRVAAFLRSLGVGPETLVGVCLERSTAMVVAMLGILEAGAAYLPLDPAYPPERLEFMLADAAAPVVLTQERLLPRLEGGAAGARRVCLDRDWPEIEAALAPAGPPRVVPANLAYTIYTSGSTGRPKGVAIAHRSATALLRWARELFPAEERAGALASTSICFDLSVFELFLPLCHGGTVVLAETALHLPRHPAAERVVLVNTVPSAIAELVRGEGLPPAVRTVVLAGEPLPRKLVDELHAAGVERVVNGYGPSEDTTYSTWALIDRSGGPPPIGRPVGGGRAYVVDARLQPVPLGVVGELYLGGAGLARGYLGRPELTAERFVPDPFSGEPGARLYRTGDLVRHRPDGEMLFLGRADHQVKVRGFRIELGEIEAALRRHPGVADAVAMARGEAGDLRLVAYVVGREGGAPAPEELRAHLRVKLPAHMVPWAFVPLAALPLNANGKVDRKALPDPERSAWGAAAQVEEPQTETEKAIAAVWREVLKLDRVGIDDNFFDSGGHSLLAVRVHHRLKGALGRDLPLVALFEHPTIRALARSLEAGEAEPASRQRGQDRGAKRREAAAGRRRPPRSGPFGAPGTEDDSEETDFP